MPWSFSRARVTELLLFAAIIASVAGCGRTVSSTELPGTWTMSRNSQHLFPADFDVTSATLVFKSDGTFTAFRMPQEVVLIHSSGSDAIARINGSGRWVLLERLGFSDATGFMLEFKAIQGPGKYELPISTMLLSVCKAEGIVKIYYFHDDPDLGRRVEFEKQK